MQRKSLKKFPAKNTIDNSATATQIETAAAYQTNNPNYRDAAAQPRVHSPRTTAKLRLARFRRRCHHFRTTPIGVMRLLKEITQTVELPLGKTGRTGTCQQALARALRVLLDCQIVVDGKDGVVPTADHETLKPVKRGYELPSISGVEA